MACGIVGYGIEIPKRRIKAEKIIDVWKNTDINLIESVFRVKERTVLNSDEDTTTLAVGAARSCLKNCDFCGDAIEAIFLGTATNPDLSRATGTVVMSALTSNSIYYGADIQAAENSGAAALIAGQSLVQSNTALNALIIGADTKSRHIAPGDLRESYCGSGAAGLLLGKQNMIAVIDGISSYRSNFPDEIRTEDERYIRTLMPLNRERLELGYVKHSLEAIKGLLDKTKSTIDLYDYFVAYQPYPTAMLSLAERCKIAPSKAIPALYAEQTGDIGSASVLVGLAKVLDLSSPGEKILMCSYGAGAGADAVSFTVTDEISIYRKNKTSAAACIENGKIYVDYAQAVKFEFKYMRSDQALNTFL